MAPASGEYRTPTPGWLNVGRPPAITGVTYTVPLANVPVTVTATISDEGNITATLWYRVHRPRKLRLPLIPQYRWSQGAGERPVRRHSARFCRPGPGSSSISTRETRSG